jgi:hypothetical protein
LSIEVPLGAHLLELALDATESLTVGDGVLVQSTVTGTPADIASTGTLETNIGADAVIGGDVWSVGSVMLRERGTVQGDVTTEGTFGKQNVWTVLGAIHEGATLTPPKRLAWQVPFPPPVRPVSVLRQQTELLVPGSYDSVSVQGGGKLELMAGTYYARTLTAESGSTISVDASAGPVFVYVMNGLTYRGSIEGVDPQDFFIGYAGQGTADIDSPFVGTVVAPNATLRLSPVDGSGREGSFFGHRILADARNPIRFEPFAHWDWIFPPRLILECLSRSAARYGAGVFGYENILDFEVRIPEGPRNSVTQATRRTKGPLEVFAPGEHRNVYWLPFRGEAIEWTLGGNTSVVNDSVPRCTLDNYHFELAAGADDESLAIRPAQPLPPGVAAAVTGVKPPLLVPDGSTPQLVQGTASPSQLGILVTGIGIGIECVSGNYDVDIEARINGQSETRNIFREAWEWHSEWNSLFVFPGILSTSSHAFRNLDELFGANMPPGSGTVPVEILLWERDSGGLCGGDDHEVVIDLHVNTDTGEVVLAAARDWQNDSHQVYLVTPDPALLPANGDPNRPEYCASGDGGWGMCLQVQMRQPVKICAQWPVQYLDSGRGETDLATSDVQQVPASYARVRLDVTGGAVPFTPWPPGGYAVLDDQGCLPAEVSPLPEQLRPAAGSEVLLSLLWLGELSLPVGANGEALQVVIDRTDPEDPWVACGCTGDAFVKPVPVDKNDAGCYAPGSPHLCGIYPPTYWPAWAQGVLPSDWAANPAHITFTLGSGDPNPTVFSNTGGFVSYLLHLHSKVRDLGLSPGTIHIWPESVAALRDNSAENGASGAYAERFIHFRPDWHTEDRVTHARSDERADSSMKFVMAHEFGHAVQYMGAGDISDLGYGLMVDNGNGPEFATDPESLPPECRCAQVAPQFSPLHCMNSIERVGAGSGEGFGHFFANRIWNDPALPGGQCWFPYAKSTYMPTCPTSGVGLQNTCIQLGSPEGQAKVNQIYVDKPDAGLDYTVDRNHLTNPNELGGWYYVQGPTLMSCSDSTVWRKKWRNNYCSEGIGAGGMDAGHLVSDLSLLGAEADWMPFFWNLTREDNAWTLGQFFALQRAACGDRLCLHTDNISGEAWVEYEALIARLAPEVGVTIDQWNKLNLFGDTYGVSTDLTPSP